MQDAIVNLDQHDTFLMTFIFITLKEFSQVKEKTDEKFKINPIYLEAGMREMIGPKQRTNHNVKFTLLCNTSLSCL